MQQGAHQSFVACKWCSHTGRCSGGQGALFAPSIQWFLGFCGSKAACGGGVQVDGSPGTFYVGGVCWLRQRFMQMLHVQYTPT